MSKPHPAERDAIDTFLTRHNQRGSGSRTGYVAYYAAVTTGDEPLLDRIVAAAKFCPLHTPQAARFFAGDDWRHVYGLQRLAAYRTGKNLLSKFLSWCLREMGKDERVWYIATYADAGTVDPRNGHRHNGAIYRATNAVYCGMTRGGRVEGFVRDGQRRSMRCGPRTWTVRELEAINAQARAESRPEPIRLVRAGRMHRYCWAVGKPLARRARRRTLVQRMKPYRFVPAWQPRLLAVFRRRLLSGAAQW